MTRSTEDKKIDSLSLCYEVVLPGLGSKNDILSLIFIFLSIYKTYSYITPEVIDYKSGLRSGYFFRIHYKFFNKVFTGGKVRREGQRYYL